MRATLLLLLLCVSACRLAPVQASLGRADAAELRRCESWISAYYQHPEHFWTISAGEHGWKLYDLRFDSPVAVFYDDGSCFGPSGGYCARTTLAEPDTAGALRVWIPRKRWEAAQ